MRLSNYDLNIMVNNRPLKEYFHEGNHFIEGRKGSPFTINIKNNTSSKIKAIISVDGLSVIDGKEAGINSDAYVVDGYGNIDVKGWRTSESTINEFYFSNKKQSYNKRTDQNSKNVGVIGVMLFSEKVVWNYIDNWNSYPLVGSSADYSNFYSGNLPVSSCVGPISLNNTRIMSSNLGTGFGNEIQSNVTKDYTDFQENPSEIMCIYYDDREGLEKRGIVVDPYKSMPNAFPSYLTRDKFAKRPLK